MTGRPGHWSNSDRFKCTALFQRWNRRIMTTLLFVCRWLCVPVCCQSPSEQKPGGGLSLCSGEHTCAPKNYHPPPTPQACTNKPFAVSHILHRTIYTFISFIISISVNDIVAVGVENFYASNDRFFLNDALQFLSIFLGVPSCQVVYYSPKEVRVAADGISSANGINISPDKQLFTIHFICFVVVFYNWL